MNCLILIKGFNNISHKIINQTEINLAMELIMLVPSYEDEKNNLSYFNITLLGLCLKSLPQIACFGVSVLGLIFGETICVICRD